MVYFNTSFSWMVAGPTAGCNLWSCILQN